MARLFASDLHKRCTLWSRLVQLTWGSSKALSYAVEDLEDVQELRTPLSDGWGVTHTGNNPVSELIISDGSAALTVVDSKTLEKKGTIEVSSVCRALAWPLLVLPTSVCRLALGEGDHGNWMIAMSGEAHARPRLPLCR